MKAADNQRAPIVWLLRDQKPGHINQLRGLGSRLRTLAGADVRDIDTTQVKVSLWRALIGIPPKFLAPTPSADLIVATGHSTHRLLLSLRRKRRCRTAVLMRPGFPLVFVDAVIAPYHDGLPERPDILSTEGVLNAITPLARITDKTEALALIGGPSDHFEWDEDVIIEQLLGLMTRYPKWNWTISGSRRTPDSTQRRLEALAGLKVKVVDHTRTHEKWLSHQFSASRAVWVTPDSGSMLCEAATSGVPTGLFELRAKRKSRVARGVKRLLDQGFVAPWSDHASVMGGQQPAGKPLWEADRAARWLIDRYLNGIAL